MKNFINRNGNVYPNICIQILQNIQEETEWDIVIMYVCNLNNIPVENKHKQIMQKKIKNVNRRHLQSYILGQYSPG